jgi:hypothetical protein
MLGEGGRGGRGFGVVWRGLGRVGTGVGRVWVWVWIDQGQAGCAQCGWMFEQRVGLGMGRVWTGDCGVLLLAPHHPDALLFLHLARRGRGGRGVIGAGVCARFDDLLLYFSLAPVFGTPPGVLPLPRRTQAVVSHQVQARRLALAPGVFPGVAFVLAHDLPVTSELYMLLRSSRRKCTPSAHAQKHARAHTHAHTHTVRDGRLPELPSFMDLCAGARRRPAARLDEGF